MSPCSLHTGHPPLRLTLVDSCLSQTQVSWSSKCCCATVAPPVVAPTDDAAAAAAVHRASSHCRCRWQTVLASQNQKTHCPPSYAVVRPLALELSLRTQLPNTSTEDIMHCL